MKRVWIPLLALCLMLSALAAPVATRAQSDVGGTIPSVADEEVQQFMLENGLEVLLVARPNVPVAIVDVWVAVGSVNEPPALNGIAHFFEHMIFKGSQERLGMVDIEVDGLGGTTNAATSFDYTHYYINVPSEHIAQAIDILADNLINGAFPAEELELEREVVLREGDQRNDNPATFLGFQFYQTFYDEHPYSMPILGTPDTVGAITREDFLNFLDQYYVPNNMTVVVVGDIDVDETLTLIEDTFGAMEPRALPDFDPPRDAPHTAREVMEIERDVAQGRLIMGWPAPSIDQPQDVYAMDVLLQVLSGGRGSRFYKHIERDLGIVTSVDASYFTTHYPGVFLVSAQFPYENRALVEEALLTELQEILDGNLTQDELARAQTMLLSGVARGRETNAGLAGALGFYAVVADDYEFALTYPDGIASVTVDDVVDVARAYIDPDAYLEMVLVPQSFDAEAAADASGIQTLDNGLRLILRAEPQTDVVALQTFVGTGAVVESADQAGISELTQRLLLRGTQNRSEEEFFEELENLGAQIEHGVLPDMVNLALVATRETWQDALPLYLDALLNPAFTEEEFRRVQTEMLREIDAAQDNLGTVAYDALLAALYGPGGYGNPSLGTVESIGNLTLADVREFYATYYVPNNMVISAAGGFNAQLLAAQLTTRLGALPPGADNLAPTLPNIALDENQETHIADESNLVWLYLGFPAPPVADPDYPAMKVLNSVLGGGMSSRLFTELREQQGLAYSTGSFFPSREGDSHLVTYIIALPENAQLAQEGILSILADITENGISDADLERAINKEVGSYVLRRETAQRRAFDIGWYEMLGAGIELDATYPDRLRQVTADDVQRVAAEYLENYVVSSVGPTAE